jgi:hypothetical protein
MSGQTGETALMIGLRSLPLWILIAFMLLGLTYASAMPAFESSDEAAHFLYVDELSRTHALPVIADRDAIAHANNRRDQWAIERHQPPLYYLIGALLIGHTQRTDLEAYLQPNPLIFIRGTVSDNHHKWLHPPAELLTGDTANALSILRLYSLTLAAISLWTIYQTTRLLFGSEAIALTTLALVATIPTLINISSSVNNDNLVILLYSAGVYWTVRTWRNGITRRSTLALSLILALIAITKITGVSLFGVVYLTLIAGALTGRWSIRTAIRPIMITLITVGVIAGWWYLRNWTLYGDPLALGATQALWGREFAVASESGNVIGEITRIWRSFWLMIGHLHQPVYGPIGFYLYVTVIAGLAIIGLVTQWAKWRAHAGMIALCLSVVILLTAQLAIGTRSVDISYGRLLFPALIGFAPLLVIGWRSLLGRYAPLLILPIALIALLVPGREIAQGYPRLEVVEAIDPAAVPIQIRTDDLMILAYRLARPIVHPDGDIVFDLYLSGSHPDNPALYLTVIDPITGAPLGKSAIYPGSAPTDALQAEVIYRVPIRVQVDSIAGLSPRLLQLQLGWQTALETVYLPMQHADGSAVPALILNGAVWIDRHYQPPTPSVISDAQFGDAIRLIGYTLNRAGDTLDLTFNWQAEADLSEDWMLTVQLLDADGTLITQSDGAIPGYPTSAWVPGTIITDHRRLTIPREGTVMIGWYRLSDFARLDLPDSANDLYLLR